LHEAISGQSKKDFFAKICIAYKEANESEYWLWLIESSGILPYNMDQEKALCKEIIKMLAKTKITTENNMTFDRL
jgi:four helix bundle protein